MEYTRQAQKTIKKALDFLKKSQARNGEFPNYTSTKQFDFIKAKKIPVTFMTSNILHTLSFFSDRKEAKEMIQKSSEYLLKEARGKYKTLNYWPRGTSISKKLPIPDDLDDTCVAYSALHMNKKYFGEEVFAILPSLEVKNGGPYYTWITDISKNTNWKDLELGVNTNILWYCSLNRVYLPNLLKYILGELKEKNIQTHFYPSYTILYYISRAIIDGDSYTARKENLEKKKPDDLLGQIEQQILIIFKKLSRKTEWRAPIATALALTTLLNFEYKDESTLRKLYKRLISQQERDGSWPAGALNVGHNSIYKEAQSFDGSKSLTTAFALEAIHKYLNRPNTKSTFNSDFPYPQLKGLYQNIKKSFFSRHKSVLKKAATRELFNKIMENTFTIRAALLPFFTFKMLSKNASKKIIQKDLLDLAANNIIGWSYYYLHDKYIDEGLKDESKVSIMEYTEESFHSFFEERHKSDKNALSFFKKSNKIYQNAVRWELENCRVEKQLLITKNIPNFRNFSQLYKRSIPYVYSTASIFFQAGLEANDTEFKEVIKAIKMYLVAKQLYDDVLDWQDDLKWGHINSVSSLIFKDELFKKKNTLKINKTTLKLCSEAFNERVHPKTMKIILRKISVGLNALDKANLSYDKPVRNMLEGLERIAHDIIREQKVIEMLQ